MKKYFLFALMAVSLVSCEEELTTNTPTFEAMKSYDFWRATQLTANFDNGNLVIVGANDSEKIQIDQSFRSIEENRFVFAIYFNNEFIN